MLCIAWNIQDSSFSRLWALSVIPVTFSHSYRNKKWQITSPGWMHESSARTWCTGKTQRDRVEREVGGGIGMGNTCISKADSCQCMTKTTTMKKKKKVAEQLSYWRFAGIWWLTFMGSHKNKGFWYQDICNNQPPLPLTLLLKMFCWNSWGSSGFVGSWVTCLPCMALQ